MELSATGWWIEEAGEQRLLPALDDITKADLVVVGGGYTGLWTAWHALSHTEPDRIVVLEADRCGHGPSGRNGSFCESYWRALPRLRAEFGDAAALRLAHASSETVTAIGQWCEDENVDAWFDRSGSLLVSTAPRQSEKVADAVRAGAELGASEHVYGLDRLAVQGVCAIPSFREAAFVPDFATVQPARLGLGLRDRLLARGVRIHENTPVRRLRGEPGGGLRVDTPRGAVRAAAGVLAINAAVRGIPAFAARAVATSSHVVATEPVPEILENLGWTNGISITDAGTLVHYFRTTRDGRIVLGWGGGPIAYGGRLHGRVEYSPETAEMVSERLRRFFPQISASQITHGWGGPIDVSPTNLPQIDSHGPLHVAFGYTGNGVGPSHMVGRILAGLALDASDPWLDLPLVGARPARRVPPEPLAWLGGSTIRRALITRDSRDVAGLRPSLIADVVTRVPALLGVHLGR